MEVRGLLGRVRLLLPWCGFQAWNSGCHKRGQNHLGPNVSFFANFVSDVQFTQQLVIVLLVLPERLLEKFANRASIK